MATINVTTYTLTLDPNGGKFNDKINPSTWPDASHPAAPTYGSTNYRSVSVATRAGYAFAGWYSSPTGGYMVYDAAGHAVKCPVWSADYDAAKWRYDGNVTVYAHWTPTTCELGYDNLFLLCDFAANSAAAKETSSGYGTVATSPASGTITLNGTRTDSNTGVYTHWVRGSNLDSSGMHAFKVAGGETYVVSCSVAKSGGGTDAKIWTFMFDANKDFVTAGGRYSESHDLSADGANSFEITVPEEAAYMSLFFYAKCSSGASVTFSKIKACRKSQCQSVSVSAVRKTVSYDGSGTQTYGALAVPSRPGYVFAGWFTGENGTGTRVTENALVQARNVSLFAKWDQPRQFGKDGCTTIEMQPFTPICSHPDIGGSTAMSLSIPVPTFAPAIPPQECVCFEFGQGQTEVDVKKDCADTTKARFTIDIDPATDCCSGRYTLRPTLDVTVPCVPFTPTIATAPGVQQPQAGAAAITVRNKSRNTERLVDGGVSIIGLRRGTDDNCCTVEPIIDITLPDCKKGYSDSAISNAKVSFCYRDTDGKVKRKSEPFVNRMVQDEENCSLYPEFKTVELPCCNMPDIKAERFGPFDIGHGGSITLVMNRSDCVTTFTMDVTPISVNIPTYVPPAFCLADTESNFNVTYTDSDDNEVTVNNAGHIKLKSGDGGSGCLKYTPTITLNLGKIDAGSGTDFTNGGHVFKDEETEELCIDGALVGSATTWFGGGVGNRTEDNQTTLVYCRGPLMRGGDHENHATLKSLCIPFDTIAQQRLTNQAGTTSTTTWASTRASRSADGTADLITDDSNLAYKFGNLNMVLPSGFQWHDRGVAAVMSEFAWTTSGVLSYVDEKTAAALLSPAPSGWKSVNANGNVQGKNASGLALDYSSNMLPGLMVNYGHGLRIGGRKYDGTPDTTYSGGNDRIGQLEIYNGYGLRIGGCNYDGTTDSNYSGTADRVGQLEIYAHNKDFAFDPTTHKLLLNDKVTDESYPMQEFNNSQGEYAGSLLKHWNRANNGTDYTIPIVVTDPDDPAEYGNSDINWVQYTVNGTTNYRWRDIGTLADNLDIAYSNAGYATESNPSKTYKFYIALYNAVRGMINYMDRLRAVFMHVSKSGVITGVDMKSTGSTVARRCPSTITETS